MEEKATGGTTRLRVHHVPVDNSVIRAEAKYGSRAVFYKFWAVKQLKDWSARVWRMFRGNVVEEFAQILSEGGDQVWLRKTGPTESVQEEGGTFDPHCCIRLPPLAPFWSSLRQRRTRGAIIFPSVIFFIIVQSPWAPQQWSCLCCDVPSFNFLPSPFNVQSSQWQVDYKVPKFWSNQHDKPSLRGLRGSYEIPCFDERNKRAAELQVRGADGVIDVFVWSFSVPNGRAATHQTAASILLPPPRRILLFGASTHKTPLSSPGEGGVSSYLGLNDRPTF